MLVEEAAVRVLALILMLGAVLRFSLLSSVPTELDFDEIDLYNSVHSIVTTGHDVDGSLKPFLYAKATRNPPIYGIAAYASSLVFGKTPFGLRFPAALFGLISILLIYAIARELTMREGIAQLAALTMAIAPIFVHFSRTAWEPSSELPFLLGGIYLLLLAVRQPKPPRLTWAALLLGLTAYTYMAGWFYALALGAPLVLIYALRHHARWPALRTAAVWLIVALPALWMFFFDDQAANRLAQISTFHDTPLLVALRTFAANYFVHFRWSYLATTGDPQPGITWRYLNGFGAFYWWIVPLAALGVFAVLRYVRDRALAWWVLLWLLVYPLGGALTNEGAPNAPRTLAGAPVFCLLAAMGFALLLDWVRSLRKRPRLRRELRIALNTALFLAATISVAQFANFYFGDYVHTNSNAWDSGTSAMFAKIVALSPGYERVCFAVNTAWYNPESYARYYLEGVKIEPIYDLTDPQCRQRGTLFAYDPHEKRIPRHDGFVPLATIDDVDGNTFALIIGKT